SNWRRRTIRASQTSGPGKSVSPRYRTRTLPATSVLDDATVRRIVAAAYEYDGALGLMVEVAAGTGGRRRQLARPAAADLPAHGPEPRLFMPLSAKGRARNKRHERRPVPITMALASVLKREAAGRLSDAPLLLRASGERWGHGRRRHHRNDSRAVV